MKTILFVLFLLLLFLPENVAAQNGSVRITPKKVVYQRRGKGVDGFKKSFTVRYPVVGGVAPRVKRRIENTIDYWRVFETSLADNLEYTWLSALNYKVGYNKNHVLDIALTIAGEGAYPDERTENFVINLETGARVRAADVFEQTKLNDLAALARKKQLLEIKQAVRDIKNYEKQENPRQAESLDEEIEALYFAQTDFAVADLEKFSVGDKGVTFLYDYGFNHATEFYQPPGRLFCSYAELKPFLRRNGLLARFVR